MNISLQEQSAWKLMKRFGTSYFWATLLLPADIQYQTLELYKFVRIPDQIVDAVNNNNKCYDLEQLYYERKNAYESHNITHSVFGEWIRIMDNKKIEYGLIDSFYESMKRDLIVNRYDTYESLCSYMYGSAQVVGLIMCDVIGYNVSHKELTLCGARKLGEAMQLTNFLRDVYEDYTDLDRIYMPSDELEKFGISHSTIIEYCQTKNIDEKWIEYMKYMIKYCDQLYDQSNETIKYLSPSCQSAIILSSDLYREILRKIESIGYNQFAHSARTTKRDKFKVIIKRQLLCKLSMKYCRIIMSKN